MLKRYHHIVGGIFRVVDACVIGAIWLASYWARFHVPLVEVTKGFPKFEKYAALAPLVMILWAFVFSSMKVYQSRRMLRRTHEAHLLLKAHGVAMLFFNTIIAAMVAPLRVVINTLSLVYSCARAWQYTTRHDNASMNGFMIFFKNKAVPRLLRLSKRNVAQLH